MPFRILAAWQPPETILNQLSFESIIWGNAVGQWVTAVSIAVLSFMLLPIGVAIVRKRVEALVEVHPSRWLKAIAVVLAETKMWFLFAVSLRMGSVALSLPDSQAAIGTAAFIILLLQAGVWGTHVIDFLIARNLEERLEKDPASVTTMSALGFIGKFVLYTIILLLTLQNLGKDVSALIAGLGVGGIAVALAAQNILGDLFSSMSIVLDKPFLLGDFIVVGDIMGTVEKIGLKTTRLRSVSGEQLIVANSDLLSSRIRNYKRMYERRVVFSIGVTYDTSRDKLEAIPGLIRAAVEAQEQTRFDRAHFAKYGDFAIIFESVYYVLSPDYSLYMDIQQAINLQLFGDFESQQIEFAFPTQTVFLRQESNSVSE